MGKRRKREGREGRKEEGRKADKCKGGWSFVRSQDMQCLTCTMQSDELPEKGESICTMQLTVIF